MSMYIYIKMQYRNCTTTSSNICNGGSTILSDCNSGSNKCFDSGNISSIGISRATSNLSIVISIAALVVLLMVVVLIVAVLIVVLAIRYTQRRRVYVLS